MAMKIRTTKYIIKEGMLNAYRNKLMSLASLSIVTASLVIFGIFFLVTLNLDNNIKGLKEQPEIQIFCFPELDDRQTNSIEENIKADSKILGYKVISKKEAFDKVKEEMFKGKESLLDGLTEEIMPVSFVIKLKDPKDGEKIVSEYSSVDGIEKVTYPQQTVEFISRITYWIPLISLILLIILLVVSMFIISNTIKLTVFARRREINIMKYIGATDWFIRWPFIIEGVIIGLIGAVIAFVLVSYGYNVVENRVSSDLTNIGISIIKLISLKEVGLQIISIYALIGLFVGTTGSAISIRKYLHV
jgi:cell division transport system permease protein